MLCYNSNKRKEIQLTNYTISRNDLKTTCGFGDVRVRNLLTKPRKLIFSAEQDSQNAGGRRTQFYRLIDVLPRLREKYSETLFTAEKEAELVALDQQRRNEFGQGI
jgi:hypothetical protein